MFNINLISSLAQCNLISSPYPGNLISSLQQNNPISFLFHGNISFPYQVTVTSFLHCITLTSVLPCQETNTSVDQPIPWLTILVTSLEKVKFIKPHPWTFVVRVTEDKCPVSLIYYLLSVETHIDKTHIDAFHLVYWPVVHSVLHYLVEWPVVHSVPHYWAEWEN